MKLRFCLLVFMTTVMLAEMAVAFPTLTRKGYTSCATCHYNPSGGGSLTSYGKYIAQEVYGIFNDSSNAVPFLVNPDYDVGTFKEPWLVAAAMMRGVQVFTDSDEVRKYKTNRMQLDLEIGAAQNGWQAIATLGPRLDSAIPGQNEFDSLELRRWWVGKVVLEYAVRAGKFMPEFGVYHPNHNIPPRKGLYFNHNEEPDIFQATKFSETFDYTVALLRGSKETELEDKQGYMGTVAYKTGMSRYGVSYLDMSNSDDDTQDVASGVFAQVGHLQHYYLLAELDKKEKYESGNRIKNDTLGYMELGWEFGKAISTYFSMDYTNRQEEKMTITAPGVGFLIYPLTHTEVAVQFGRSYADSDVYGSSQANRGFLMMNVYF